MSYQNRSLREIIEDNNTALVASIATETSRAQTAEQANAAAILAEEQRVDAILLNAPPLLDTFKEVVDAYEAADQSLTLITNNNTNNITANSNALSAEITRATAAESANTTAITNEVTRATAAESANATDIATETTRATTAETANTTAINNEIARATAAEGANTTNLNNEITRAQTAEGLNTTNLNAEITRAIAAEGLNTSNLNAEITRATNAETANATAIATKQNTITASTPLTTGVLTATQSTNDIDIRNNISAGSNITLTQTGNVTQIASSGGSAGVNLPNPVIGVKMWVGATSAGATNIIKLVNSQVPANSTRQVFECSAYTFIESSSNGSSWTCDFDCDYEYAGSASDTVKSRIYWRINNGAWQNQGHRNQKFDSGGGGGTRSGVIFPAHISKPLALTYNAGDTIKMRVDVETSGDDILYIRSGTNETKCTAVFQEIKENNVNNVNSSTNLTVASITATGSTNDIDLRNNIIAGTGINLTQISNTTGIAVDPAPLNAEIARATAAEGANATNIATNTTDIASNTTDIATNTTAIATNATNIATNTTDIASNTTAIATNATNIATNTTDIATNATAITTKQDTITGSTALTTGALTATAATNDIDIRNNITAGSNITLTQTGNVTEIASSGGGGAATSVQYGWSASCTANGFVAQPANTNIPFNSISQYSYRDFETPAGAGNYNTSNYYYEVVVAGYYQVGFNLYTNGADTTAIVLIAKTTSANRSNYLVVGQTGQETRANEDCKLIAYFDVGDYIYIRNGAYVVNFNYAEEATFFYGFLLSGSSQLATSTQYYFKANGTANQSLATGATNEVVNFNNVLFQNPTGYDTTNKEYVVQVAGVYQFFYQLFFAFNNANAEVRLGMYLTRGGTTTTINQTGQYIYTSERLGLTYECLVGDKISVRCVYNNSGGTISVVLGQSIFEGYLLQPENNTVTSTTDLTTATIIAQGTTNDIDLRNNISAGSNITLTQTGNVTEIASSGGGRIVFSAVRSSTLTPVNNANNLHFIYDSTKITNSSYFSLSGDTLTILVAGDYLISATVNWENYNFNTPNPPRFSGRLRTLTNNTFVGGSDAIALCYGRHKDYGRFESTTLANYPRTFAANDTLKIEITVIKSSESINFTSNFNGLRFPRGSNLTVEKIN